jgi:hypothetical protein
MSSIEKIKVIDSRIVQTAPKFAVNEGAPQVSNPPFHAVSSTSSNMSFNINAPSKNVFMDREVSITTGVRMKALLVLATAPADPLPPNPAPLLRFGQNIALPAFPLQSMMNTLSITVNNSTITANQRDVIYELLRLTANSRNNQCRTTPSMLDRYVNNSDAFTFGNSPISGYQNALTTGSVPNGAYPNIRWLDANGNDSTEPLPVAGQTDYNIYWEYTITEKLVLSPFIFAEEEYEGVGLYGINNIQILANFGADMSKNIRWISGDTAFTIQNVNFFNTNPFVNPVVNCVFRNPCDAIPLPPKSIVPFMETPRYISSNTGVQIPSGQTRTLTSNTIVLSQIPDMMLIYVKPNSFINNGGIERAYDGSYGDFYLPVSKFVANFDNNSGMMSSITREQLFQMTVNNNFDVNYPEFLGEAHVNNAESVSLVGSPIVLRPGKDFPLASGSASGLGGNYTLQFQIEVKNQTANTVSNPIIYCMVVNSGFFETDNGTSVIKTAPLTSSEVFSAPVMSHSAEVERMVGGSFWSKLGSTLKSIVKHPIYKTISSTAKSLARSSGNPTAKKIADVADAVGLGKSTGGKRKAHNLDALL